MCRCSFPCGIERRLAAFSLITLNTNIIIVNAPPHSWALISCCATVLLGMAQWSGDVVEAHSTQFDWAQSMRRSRRRRRRQTNARNQRRRRWVH